MVVLVETVLATASLVTSKCEIQWTHSHSLFKCLFVLLAAVS